MEGFVNLSSTDCFKGQWLSAPTIQKIEGDIVFFTGMTGYQEALSDPAYKDKIVVFTYPLIGNCGVKEADFINKPHLACAIVFEGCKTPSHYESSYSLEDYFKKWELPLLSHVDTRAVIKKARKYGIESVIVSTSKSVCLSEKGAKRDEYLNKVQNINNNQKRSVIEYA